MLFECGKAALFELWQLDVSRLGGSGSQATRAKRERNKSKKAGESGEQKDRYFLVGAESDVRHYRPLPGGPFHPSLPCCLSVANRSFRALAAGRFEAWRIRQSGSKKASARAFGYFMCTWGFHFGWWQCGKLYARTLQKISTMDLPYYARTLVTKNLPWIEW